MVRPDGRLWRIDGRGRGLAPRRTPYDADPARSRGRDGLVGLRRPISTARADVPTLGRRHVCVSPLGRRWPRALVQGACRGEDPSPGRLTSSPRDVRRLDVGAGSPTGTGAGPAVYQARHPLEAWHVRPSGVASPDLAAMIRQCVGRVLTALLLSVTAGCAGSAPSEATASHPMSVDPDQAIAAVTDLNGDLWLMTAEGARLAKLVDIAERIGSPSWSPGGSMLAFDAGSSSFIVDADGTNVRQLAAGVRNPAWSPDGTRLAVSNGQLGLVEADGSGLRFLSPTVPGIHPAWAPDGRSIAYASAGPPFDIWTVRPDGSDVTNLTSSESYDMFPALSPDGARIAFDADANTSTTGP